MTNMPPVCLNHSSETLLPLTRLSSGPVLMSLKPGTRVANPYPETPADKGLVRQLSWFQMGPAVGTVPGADLDLMEEVTSVLLWLQSHPNQTHTSVKPLSAWLSCWVKYSNMRSGWLVKSCHFTRSGRTERLWCLQVSNSKGFYVHFYIYCKRQIVNKNLPVICTTSPPAQRK